MAADNVKTAFHLPGQFNENFIRNLIWQHQQQQHQRNIDHSNNKISTNSHQVFRDRHRKRPVLKSLFNKVSGLQAAALSKRDSDTGAFRGNY